MSSTKKIILYFTGFFVLAYSQLILGGLNYGTSPVSAFMVGATDKLFGTLGLWNNIVNLVFFVLSCLAYKKLRSLKIIGATIIFSIVFDLCAYIVPSAETLSLLGSWRILLAVICILASPFGCALYFVTGYPVTAFDDILVTFTERFKPPLWVYKVIIDCILTILAFTLSGPVGVFTLIFSFSFGPLLNFYIKVLSKAFGQKSDIA